jgi:hypothetical protein
LGSIGEIVAQLERDPGQCWLALEGLRAVEPDERAPLIAALSAHQAVPGVATLLRLLATTRDPVIHGAARSPMESGDVAAGRTAGSAAQSGALGSLDANALAARLDADAMAGHEAVDRVSPRLEHSLVTPVDGEGSASIVVSASALAQRRTAAFLCDLHRGICDVVGEVARAERRSAGFFEELRQQWGSDCVCDVPELALGLLAGALLLSGDDVPDAVRDWLIGTLGPGFRPAAFPVEVPGVDLSPIPDAEIPGRAYDVIDACPSWLDRSALTFELAEELALREPGRPANPGRDAGAYRFLFEHRLIHRLEAYRRMLLWMAWLWPCSGEIELARSGLALARLLSDEQYVVPSNPFTVALTSRSIEAAQARLGTAADPRTAGDPN